MSGSGTTTCRSNRPGRSKRRVEHVGPVGRRDHDHAVVPSKPSIDEQLVQRLLALVVAAAQARAALAADRVDFIDNTMQGACFFRLVEHVAHARAPTPTNISTKSEPEIEKTAPWPRPRWRARAASCPCRGCRP